MARTTKNTKKAAAPATPASKPRIRRKSNIMFSMEDRARKYTGVRLSPRERMIPARRLYRNVVGMPMKMMKM